MNFQKIPPIERADFFLDHAFSKARTKAKQKDLTGNWLQIIRMKEGLKLDVAKDQLAQRLDKVTESFPNFDKIPFFYIRLMKLTLDFKGLKQSLAAVMWARKRIGFFHKESVRKIFASKKRDEIKNHSKQCYGRISSVMKQIDKQLVFLEDARRTMRTYPDIKDRFTVAIYGFPNIGKSTLLNTMTGTKAKAASYAFTTKTINTAHIEIGGFKIQVLDVPGTLSRDKYNPIEMQAEIVIEDLADLVIYIFDMTEPFPVKSQLKLYNKLRKEKSKKNIMVFLSKQDILKDEEKEDFDILKSKEKIEDMTIDQIKETIAKRAKPWYKKKEEEQAALDEEKRLEEEEKATKDIADMEAFYNENEDSN